MVGLESIWATYVTNTSKANTLLQHPPKMRDSITSSSGAMIWAIVEGDVVIGKRRMNEGKEKERNENRTRERNLSLFSISNSAVRRSIGEHCSAFNLDTPRSSYNIHMAIDVIHVSKKGKRLYFHQMEKGGVMKSIGKNYVKR
jgi:hypothetical protein